MEAVIRLPLSALSFACGLLLLAGPTSAHKLSSQRSIMFEPVGQRELHVLVRLEVPAGKPTVALMLSFDLDRSGELDREEEDRLKRHLTERAFANLELSIDGQPARLGDAKSELRRGPRGGFELMVYAKLDASSSIVSVQLASDASAEPVDVVLLGGTRAIRRGFGVRQSDGGFRGALGAAARIGFELDAS